MCVNVGGVSDEDFRQGLQVACDSSHLDILVTSSQADKVFVPIHEGPHWTVACIDMKKQTMHYWDSMSSVVRLNNVSDCWLVLAVGSILSQ